MRTPRPRRLRARSPHPRHPRMSRPRRIKLRMPRPPVRLRRMGHLQPKPTRLTLRGRSRAPARIRTP